MLILLLTILGLMLWSIRLMISAFQQRDFSLLFAGTLVALSSAGIVTAYSLMNGCMGYLSTSDNVAQSYFAPVHQISPAAPMQETPVWIEDMPL